MEQWRTMDSMERSQQVKGDKYEESIYIWLILKSVRNAREMKKRLLAFRSETLVMVHVFLEL